MKTFYERFKDRIDWSDNSAVLFEDEYKAIQLDALRAAREHYNILPFGQADDAILSRIRELDSSPKKEGR